MSSIAVDGSALPPDPENVPYDQRPDVYGWPRTDENGYTIKEQPSGTRKPLRVVVAGAGASGINFAKFAREELEDVQVNIFDKNNDVGGTWLENRYPGCACDIPSVSYQFSWEPAIWSQYYSEAREIFAYFKGIVDKYDLWKYMHLNHRVDKVVWSSEGHWTVTVTDLVEGRVIEEECDVFLNACGPLNHWEWPNIDGLQDYQGQLVHSAAYPEGLDLKGKRVAVVGTGSSGIQIVANIQKEVEHLYVWGRSAGWLTAGFAQKYSGPDGANFMYSEEQKKRFQEDPKYYLKYRKAVETEMSKGFLAYHLGTPQCLQAQKFARARMLDRLEGRDELIDTLIPKTFPVGCKRPTPGVGFLEALVAPNVTTFLDGLKTITPEGFLDPTGHEHKADVIILATGFNTTWIPRFPVIANGVNLQDLYSKRPVSYLGVAAPQMPNYFTFYGPYGPLAAGSALPTIELFTFYIIDMLRKMQVEHIKSYTPRARVIDDFDRHAQLFLKRTVWSANCRSWFKGGQSQGRIMVYPGTRNQYFELVSSPRYEDYEIEYDSNNVWSWLGNGFSTRDLDGRDLTKHMGLLDGLDRQIDYDV